MVRNLAKSLGFVVRKTQPVDEGLARRETCLVCHGSLVDSRFFDKNRVCPVCQFHYSMTARERIDSLVDPGTFRETNRNVTSIDPLSFSSRVSYKQRLFRDRRRTGLTEAVVTGTGTIGGNPLVLVVLDFGFMGGSMGCVVGEKVALAMEHAVKRKIPVVTIVTSGGARVQEGVLSLMQMAKTSIAASLLHSKGLPFISVLANPATGQAYASFANMADLILSEPGAIVGLAPMSVIKESSDTPLPGGSHTGESHLKHGMVDAVIHREQLREKLATLLDLLGIQYKLTAKLGNRGTQMPEREAPSNEAWRSVQLARHKSRPTSLDYIDRIVDSFIELHGDRSYGDDGAVVCGIGHLGGQTVVVIGQERGRSGDKVPRNGGRTSPEGFRKAHRTITLAAKFGLPLITLIDTPGPFTSLEAEERGLGNALAGTMAEMGVLQTPSIAVIIGEGGSEGALALAVGSRVLMMENAIFSIISPEAAAGLMYQDKTRADEAAESLKLTARDCIELGIVDQVVHEPTGGAHTNHDEAARQLRSTLLRELADLQSKSKHRLVSERYKKFRKMGEYSSHFRIAITREVNSLQGLVVTGMKRIASRRGKTKAVTPDPLPDGEEQD